MLAAKQETKRTCMSMSMSINLIEILVVGGSHLQTITAIRFEIEGSFAMCSSEYLP